MYFLIGPSCRSYYPADYDHKIDYNSLDLLNISNNWRVEGTEPRSLVKKGGKWHSGRLHHATHMFSLLCFTYQLCLKELGDIVCGAECEGQEHVLCPPAEAVGGGHQAAPVPVKVRPAHCTVSRKENYLQKFLIFPASKKIIMFRDEKDVKYVFCSFSLLIKIYDKYQIIIIIKKKINIQISLLPRENTNNTFICTYMYM